MTDSNTEQLRDTHHTHQHVWLRHTIVGLLRVVYIQRFSRRDKNDQTL